MIRCKKKLVPIHALGPLQVRLLRTLWKRGECAVHDLLADLATELAGDKLPAYVTVLTVMRRLEKRGLVSHRTEGQRFIYKPVVSKAEIERSLLTEVILPLFGSRQALVASLKVL